MKTILHGATCLVGLLVLASCGQGEPAVVATEPVAEAAAVSKPKLTAAVVDGTTLRRFLVVANRADTGSINADGSAYELRSTATKRVAFGDGDGVLARVPAETAAQLTGRRVKVTINARSAPVNGSSVFKVMYFRPGSKTGSDWQEFSVSDAFAPLSFEYDVPDSASSNGFDNIGFWADPEGKGRGIEISAITVETVD
jgi:hypothetical protein